MERLEREARERQDQSHRILQRQHRRRRLADALLQDGARGRGEERQQRETGAGAGEVRGREALPDDQHEAAQRQAEARETCRREAPLDHRQRQDRLHTQHRGEHARRHLMGERQQVEDRVEPDQQGSGQRHLQAGPGGRQHLATQQPDERQSGKPDGEAGGEKGKGCRVGKTELGRDAAAAPQQNEQAGRARGGERTIVEFHHFPLSGDRQRLSPAQQRGNGRPSNRGV
jgi:hypothetical protein